MYYQRNLPIPNLSTNDVYYKRQLSFNVYELATGRSVWYGYSEEVAKKRSMEVVSYPQVIFLTLFCDSCGRPKNYNIFRYCHYIVHELKRLKSIVLIFPIQGHSFLECDENMSLVNKKMENGQKQYLMRDKNQHLL